MNNIEKLKEKKMFKDLEHSAFLPNAFFIVLIFAILWGCSFILGRWISEYILKNVIDETLKISFRRIITCGFQICIFFIWVRSVEKRKIATIGFRNNNRLGKFLLGFCISIIAVTIMTIALYLIGAIEIEINKNINMSINTCALIAIILAGWLVQSVSEEIGIRGWLLPLIGAKYNPQISILVTSAAFGILHLFTPTATVLSFVNLILSGLFFALYTINEDSLWGVWGFHFAWNLALGNIYAFIVSGFSAGDFTIFKIKAVGNELFTGGSFGPEGGLLATIVLAIGVIVCIFRLKKNINGKIINT